jgi:hypothetical protein
VAIGNDWKTIQKLARLKELGEKTDARDAACEAEMVGHEDDLLEHIQACQQSDMFTDVSSLIRILINFMLMAAI